MPGPYEVQTQTEEQTAMTSPTGEAAGGKIREVVETGTAPFGAYIAMRNDLPWWARVAGGAVAVVNSGKFLRKVKSFLGRE